MKKTVKKKYYSLGLCPFCKSENINHDHELDTDACGAYYKTHCNDCGKDFREEYEILFVGLSWDVKGGYVQWDHNSNNQITVKY